MASRGRPTRPYQPQVQASRQAAYSARVAHLEQFPGNVAGARAAAAGAARNVFYETLAELTEALDATCPALERDEKDFLALALSQLSQEELAALPQTGGARLQKGGAIGEALRRFMTALCDRGRRAVSGTEADAAASLDLTARAITESSQQQVFTSMLTAAAGSTVIFGSTRGIAALALTAVRSLNSLIPGPVTVAVNTFNGLTAWIPVGVALTPVLGKLFTIALCLKAFQLTAAFVREQISEGVITAGNFDREQFLRALLNYVYRGLVSNAAPVASSAATTSVSAASSLRNRVAALFSRAPAAPAAPAAVSQGIDAAVQVLVEDASVQAAIGAAVTPSTGANAANAGAAGGTNGGAASLTQAQVADVVAGLGDVAVKASQAAGRASTNPSQDLANSLNVDSLPVGQYYGSEVGGPELGPDNRLPPKPKRPRTTGGNVDNGGNVEQEGGKRFKKTSKKAKKARKANPTRKARKATRKNRK